MKKTALMICLALFSTSVVAQRADDQDKFFSDDALKAHVRSAGLGRSDELVIEMKDQVKRNAIVAPESQFSATVVFERGLSHVDLARLLAAHNLDVIRIEIKIAGEGNEPTYTHSIGMRNIHKIDAPMSEQLEKVFAYARYDLMAVDTLRVEPTNGTLPDSPVDRTPLGFRPLKIYKIEIVGNAIDIKRMQDQETAVRCIFPDSHQHKIKMYDEYMKKVASTRSRSSE